jgi:predicted phosphoribosyltransferase
MFEQTYWKNRQEAAEELIGRLRSDKVGFDIVLALPRGGVVLGTAVARAFKKPLDLLIPRKIGAPMNPEYAIGAVTEEGLAVWNETEKAAVDPKWLEKEVAKERAEAKRRRETYSTGRPRLPLKEKTVLIVDDGLATGFTMRAAVAEAKSLQARQIVIAVPVAPPETVETIGQEVDKVIVLKTPAFLGAVGQYYESFNQVSDEEVIKMINSEQKPAARS